MQRLWRGDIKLSEVCNNPEGFFVATKDPGFVERFWSKTPCTKVARGELP
jgi:hypothetical protein